MATTAAAAAAAAGSAAETTAAPPAAAAAAPGKPREKANASAVLSKLAYSLLLDADTWSTVRRAGACACCAARIAGCRETAAYDCDERDLRTLLDARFGSNSGSGGDVPATAAAGGPTATKRSEICCTLCLGILQSEMPLRMTPRARPSSDLHGDDKRSCVAAETPAVETPPTTTTTPTPLPHVPAPDAPPRDAPLEEDIPLPGENAPREERGTTPASPLGVGAASEGSVGTAAATDVIPVKAGPEDTAPSSTGRALAPASAGCDAAAAAAVAAERAPAALAAATTTACNGNGGSFLHRPARIADAIAECVAARGYTGVSSFGLTAAVPACLAVRDAAFAEALACAGAPPPPVSALLQPPTDMDTSATTTADTANTTTTATDATKTSTTATATATAVTTTTATATVAATAAATVAVSVKEALKIGLVGALSARLGGAVFDADSDFTVEVTAAAKDADAHAMTALLGGPALHRPGDKPPGWPGTGRWAKKRQRREEHRNPAVRGY